MFDYSTLIQKRKNDVIINSNMKVINNSKKKQSTNSTKAFDGVIFTTDMVTHDAQNDPSHNLPLANLDCVFFASERVH